MGRLARWRGEGGVSGFKVQVSGFTVEDSPKESFGQDSSFRVEDTRSTRLGRVENGGI